MLLVLLSLVLIFVVGYVLLKSFENCEGPPRPLVGFLGIVLAMISGIGFIAYVVATWHWIGWAQQ